MSAAFTPGPWEYDGDEETVISSVNGTAIACPFWAEDIDDAAFERERMENMRLITAAPELYAALDALLHALHPKTLSIASDKARAALAKARGEQ